MKPFYMSLRGVHHGGRRGNLVEVWDRHASLAMTKGFGFTLVELMVSIAIVGLMSAAAIANFRGGARADELRLAAQETVVRIREAQVMAMTGRTTSICGEAGCQTLVPRGGYGIYLASVPASGFILFADGDANQSYEEVEALPGNVFTLPSNVEITGTTPSSPPAPPPVLIFAPPRGRVHISGGGNELRLTLKHRVSGDTKTVRVDGVTGRIEVE